MGERVRNKVANKTIGERKGLGMKLGSVWGVRDGLGAYLGQVARILDGCARKGTVRWSDTKDRTWQRTKRSLPRSLEVTGRVSGGEKMVDGGFRAVLAAHLIRRSSAELRNGT